ncbi:hypothetical protein NX059_005597 [Plenodomus lindquistii]|nr:hypothetical protein NX059_005597 [Plenodomus lindquistii]
MSKSAASSISGRIEIPPTASGGTAHTSSHCLDVESHNPKHHDFTGHSMQPRVPFGLNSPPPLPVLLPSGFKLSPPPLPEVYDVQRLNASSRRKSFVDRLDHEQEELRDARDHMLGSRFRLRARRNELRDARMAASSKDGSLLNMLRQLFFKHGLPKYIQDELEQATDLRDKLGPMEASYDALEMEYATEEYNYTLQETTFIEGLVQNDLVPINPPRRNLGDSQVARLTSFAVGVTQEYAMSLANLELLDDLDRPLPTDETEVVRSSRFSQSKSDAVAISDHGQISRDSHTRIWAMRMERIDQWLDDQLSEMPLRAYQSRAYQLTDTIRDLTDEYWKEPATQGLLPEFHTGDSTISSASISPHTSLKAQGLSRGSRLSQTNGPVHSAGDDDKHGLMEEHDTNRVLELISSSITAGNDEVNRSLHIVGGIAVSTSTDQSLSRRSSSSIDRGTASTSHDSCSGGHGTVRPVKRSTDHGSHASNSYRHHYSASSSQSAPPTPTRRINEQVAKSRVRSSSDSFDEDIDRVWNDTMPLTEALAPCGPTTKLFTYGMDALYHEAVPSSPLLVAALIPLPPSPALISTSMVDVPTLLRSQVLEVPPGVVCDEGTAHTIDHTLSSFT